MLQTMPSGITARDEISTIEPGKILFSVESLEAVYAKNNKLMFKATLRGVQPAAVNNMPHFHNFIIGSEIDPGADNPDTWTQNAGRFITFCIACNVVFDGHPIPNILQNCIGKQVGAQIKTKVQQAKPGGDTRYDGQIQANVVKWLTPGNFVPEMDSQIGAPSGLPGTAPATQQQMEAPGQGSFQAPPGQPQQVVTPSPTAQPIPPANPYPPQGNAPQEIPAQQQYVPPTEQSYAPAPPAGPPATPGMETGHYIPANQIPPAAAPLAQPAQGFDPNQGYAPPAAPVVPGGGMPNPNLPPGGLV